MAGATGKSVLFLCLGDDAYSRFAEALFNSVAARMRLPWSACSRSLDPPHDTPLPTKMDPAIADALKKLGIRPTDTWTTALPLAEPADLQKATRLITLRNRFVVEQRLPEVKDSIEFWDIPDDAPSLDLIEREVMALVARLFTGAKRLGPPPADPVIEAKPTPEAPKKPLTAKVGRETKGRRGKGVTTIFELPLNEAKIQELAALLKQRCGTGGTVKDGIIEIQGDQRERIVAELEKLGYKVKRVGG